MGRYDQTKINKKNKKNYYSTTIYEKVPERNDDMYFISQEGDRCDNLAVRFYGNPNLWWYIARVNDLKTNNIPAGISLRIPLSSEKAQGS
mgnify:FL=1